MLHVDGRHFGRAVTVLPWGDNLGLHAFKRSRTLETIDLFGPQA